MAQQAPKVAGNLAQRLFNNLKSKDFRDYLMRYVTCIFVVRIDIVSENYVRRFDCRTIKCKFMS